MWLRRRVQPAEVLAGAGEDQPGLSAQPGMAVPARLAAPPAPTTPARLAREPASGYRGRPGASPRLVLAFDQELSARLRQAAQRRGLPLGQLASELLALGLEHQDQRARAESTLVGLTPRQRQVIWMTAQGQTNRQIAQALVISPETVKTHIRHALAQLGLRSKAELRMLLLDLGMRWWEQG
jgi:DNA-binding CsgD family transcriptional regulator